MPRMKRRVLVEMHEAECRRQIERCRAGFNDDARLTRWLRSQGFDPHVSRKVIGEMDTYVGRPQRGGGTNMTRPRDELDARDAAKMPLAWQCVRCKRYVSAIQIAEQTVCRQCGGTAWQPIGEGWRPIRQAEGAPVADAAAEAGPEPGPMEPDPEPTEPTDADQGADEEIRR